MQKNLSLFDLSVNKNEWGHKTMQKIILTLLLTAISSTSLAMDSMELNGLTEKEQLALAFDCLTNNVAHTTIDFVSSQEATNPLADFNKKIGQAKFDTEKEKLIIDNRPSTDIFNLMPVQNMLFDCEQIKQNDIQILTKLIAQHKNSSCSGIKQYKNQEIRYNCAGFLGELEPLKIAQDKLDECNKEQMFFNFWRIEGNLQNVFLAVAQKKDTDDKKLSVYLFGDKPFKIFRKIAELDEDDFPTIAKNFLCTNSIIISPKNGKIHFFTLQPLPKYSNDFVDVVFNYTT